MRNYTVVLLLLASLGATAQSGPFTINGKVGKYNPPAKVYFVYKNNSQNTADSSLVKNGVFQFKGTIKEPFPATLILDSKGSGFKNISPASNADVLNMYIEKGTITLESPDSISKAKISGSPLNKDGQELKAMLAPVQQKMLSLNQEWQSASEEKQKSTEFNDEISKRYEAIQQQQKDLLKSFIKSHPGSYVSLEALSAFAGPEPEYAEVSPLFNSLSANLRETTVGKAIGEALEGGKKTAVGAMAIDFTQNDVNGKPVKLSDFRGKYLLLDFWASWCGPCRHENPNVVRVYNKYKDKNFTVLGVSLDRQNGKDAWLKAIKDDQLEWTQVSDLKFWNNKVAVLYGIRAIPQNFLIDPSGKIIAKNLRGEDLERKLAELIK
ncbi:redoxin domain-containing protein [Rubrolithibacter danxiaensis]|uniref:redoxin domain-containing protein n=1 Tax=Rubrolithibacter danxiaensis TaxID=3390805 RepID=UPI003BF83745